MGEMFEKLEHTRRTMTLFEQAVRMLHEKGIEEVERHALVARRHHCTCNECFCCAARTLADDYRKGEHYKAAAR